MTIGGVLSVRSVAVGLAVGTLGALLRADLQSKGCGRLSSIAASGFAIAQPAFLDPAIALKAVLLAFSTYAISVNAVAFSDSRDPRRIIRLGGSLASAQVLNPLMG